MRDLPAKLVGAKAAAEAKRAERIVALNMVKLKLSHVYVSAIVLKKLSFGTVPSIASRMHTKSKFLHQRRSTIDDGKPMRQGYVNSQ